MALAAVPLYLRFLGLESYGVVGMFTSFSILIGFLDLGLGATLTREIARTTIRPAILPSIRDLTRTFEFVYGLLALSAGIVIVTCATPLGQYWVQVRALDRTLVAEALTLAGVALACQWPTTLYSGALTGCHRQILLGVATMLFATLRVALTLLAILWEPTLEKFFLAQIATSVLQSLTLRWLLWRVLTLPGHKPAVRFNLIRSSLRFAGGMTGIMITSIILTQADKVILSKALTLEDFGIYVVASTLASGLYMLISPMFSVMYPRFSTLVREEDKTKLSSLYQVSGQVMAALVFPIAVILAGFAQNILFLWTGNQDISQRGALILSFLIIGNACNGIVTIPYALQLASGWTKLSFLVNIGAIALLAPAIWWAASRYGAAGGAAVWALLNISYVVLTPQIMHKRLLCSEKSTWYLFSVVLPFSISVVCVVCIFVFKDIYGLFESKITQFLIILGFWGFIQGAIVLILPNLRKTIGAYAYNLFAKL